MKTRNCVIRNCSKDNEDFEKLYCIFRDTLKPDLLFPKFVEYYASGSLQYIDACFIYHGEDVIGFSAAAFYEMHFNTKKYIIGRAAIGILPEYQGGSFSSWKLFSKYILYKIKHPFVALIITAYVANPIVYAMMCKYTAFIYPKLSTDVPLRITNLKNNILKAKKIAENEIKPFTVALEIEVSIGGNLTKRIEKNRNAYIQFFVDLTELRQKIYLLVIIPFSWLNIVLSLGLFLFVNMMKIIKRIFSALKFKSENEGITLLQ